MGAALDAELGLLVDQPFFTVRDEAGRSAEGWATITVTASRDSRWT